MHINAGKLVSIVLGIASATVLSAEGKAPAPLFDNDRFTVLNIAPFSPGTEEQLAREMIEYKDRTGNNIVLYSLSLHPSGLPAIKKAERLVASYVKLRKSLEGSGVRLGVLMQSPVVTSMNLSSSCTLPFPLTK